MDLSERQMEIIKASGKILMESGIAGLTTKNLAREMHFSESALYRHFKNKEAIITLLIAYLSENITQRFDAIIHTKKIAGRKVQNTFHKPVFVFQAKSVFHKYCFIRWVD